MSKTPEPIIEDEDCPKCGGAYVVTRCGERVYDCGSLEHPNAGITQSDKCKLREERGGDTYDHERDVWFKSR